MCQSQWSGSSFPSAAPMPPCAAPVCERTGISLLMTAVRTCEESSSAAISPVPPAPTTTTSASCDCLW